MSYGASIDSHVYNPSITAEALCGISRERPGTIVKSAPSQLEVETQLVVDRLLRECFTRKSPGGTGRIDTLTPTHAPGETENSDWGALFSLVLLLDNLADIRLMHFIALASRSFSPRNCAQ
jgi:hypothetical protein